MLVELRVENLGVIESATVLVQSGMTAITGETGAGKTLLVDALELLLGGRADPGIVRDGADEARVEGRFSVIEGAVEAEIALSRVIPSNGRSRAYVNGRIATAGELSEAGRLLVDLHGQHAHQSLLHPAEQRALLDRFAGSDAADARADLRVAREEIRRLDSELAALGGDERARAREADLLRYQLGEIEGSGIAGEDEWERLEEEEAMLADSEAVGEALGRAHEQLDGPALDALGVALAELSRRTPLAALADRVRSLQAEASDLAHELRVVAEETLGDPERLDAVRGRLRLLADLRRKYGESIAEVLAHAREAGRRLGEIEGHEERAAELTRAREEAQRFALEAAARLSACRRAAAAPLAEAVTARLRDLAMPAAFFEVSLSETELGEDGADAVELLLAPNPGEPARPLARAASGGELSRTMLALRVVLSEAPPTLVFDEVDAGIGGEAGVAVGRALATLAATHQVLCVTHLAQVAAFADNHVIVTKREAEGRTIADVSVALDDARVAELSRMLAGVGESNHARGHARELLDAAATDRSAVRVR